MIAPAITRGAEGKLQRPSVIQGSHLDDGYQIVV